MKSLYNRYIPQSDGSFQRNRIQDARVQPRQNTEAKPQQNKTGHAPSPEPPQAAPVRVPETSTGSFLRQLLPKEFDTGDLLIVLLLLLMAGDCEEEKSNALLTLALYFLL